MADAAPDDGSPPNDLNSGSGPAAIEGDALNVSVTSLGGEVLATVSVSGRASVWELKGLIHSHGLGRSAKFIETTLLLGTQVLADAASLRDVGVVDGTMLSVILAPKYKLLVHGMSGGEVELWSQEGKVEQTFVGHYDGVQDVAFSPDNNFLLSVGGICVKLWQVDRRDCIFTFWHDTPVISAAFSPTGTTVLSTQWNCDTKLWGVSSGQCIRSLPPPDTILGHTVAAFTAQGPIVLHMCDGFFTLWNMETRTTVWEYHHRDLSRHRRSGCFSRCGDLFFTLTRPYGFPCNAMDVWDVSRHRHYWRFKEPTEEITSGSFSPDGWRVLTVSQKIVRVWSLGFDSASWAFRNEGVVDWAAFAPDGVQVVTISCGYAYLWRTDCQTFRLRLPQGGVTRALFAPDGACVLLRGNNEISLWNATVKGPRLFQSERSIRAMASSHWRQ